MTARPPDDPLKALGDRLDAIKQGRKPKPPPKGGHYSAAGFGWRMTIDLVTGVLVGAAIGWGLDELTGLRPLFLIIFVLMGFAAGVKVMLKSVEDYQKDQAGADTGDGAGAGTGAGTGDDEKPG